MNLETLENRLRVLIRRLPMNNNSQQCPPQHVNSSSAIGAMIPTPGMPQCGNSSLMVTSSAHNSMNASIASNGIGMSAVNTGSFVSTVSTISSGMHTGSCNFCADYCKHYY